MQRIAVRNADTNSLDEALDRLYYSSQSQVENSKSCYKLIYFELYLSD